jgi:hypothetical protein
MEGLIRAYWASLKRKSFEDKSLDPCHVAAQASRLSLECSRQIVHVPQHSFEFVAVGSIHDHLDDDPNYHV